MKIRSITGIVFLALTFLFQPLMGVFSTSSIEITSTVQDGFINMAPGEETTFNLLFKVRDDLNYQVDISFESHPNISLNTNQSFTMNAGSTRLLSVDISAASEINIGDYQVLMIIRYYPISDSLNPNDFEESTLQTTINIQAPEKIPNALITITNFEGEPLLNSISLYKLEGENLIFVMDYPNGRMEDRLETGNYFVSSFEKDIEVLSHEFSINSDGNYRYNHQIMSHYFTELLAVSFFENDQGQIIVDYEISTLLNNVNEIWIEFSLVDEDTILENPQFQEIGVINEEIFEGRYIYNTNQETEILNASIVLTAFYFDDLERINLSELSSVPIRDSSFVDEIITQFESSNIIVFITISALVISIFLLFTKKIINQNHFKVKNKIK